MPTQRYLLKVSQFYSEAQHSIFAHALIIGSFLALFFSILLFVYVGLQLVKIRTLLTRRLVFLELTPHVQTVKTLAATQELFSVLHGFDETRSVVDKLTGKKSVISFEVVATRGEGIRYILCVSEASVPTLERMIGAYAPDVSIRRVQDYIPSDLRRKHTRVATFRQTGHFAYPLNVEETTILRDPLTYISGAMTRLAGQQLVAVQFVVVPARIPAANRLAYRLLRNQEKLYSLNSRRLSVVRLSFGLGTILFAVASLASEIFHGEAHGKNTARLGSSDDIQKPERSLGAIEQRLADAVYRKLSQPLFTVSIRALTLSNTSKNAYEPMKDIRRSFGSLSVLGFQSLRSSNHGLFGDLFHKGSAYRCRLPSLLCRESILSAEELAALYHLPNAQDQPMENVVRSLSRHLPVPVTMQQHAHGNTADVIFGQHVHQGTVTPLGLTAAERERHMYVIGGTGNGKTTMLKHMIIQDIERGKGVAVIDPHGDLAEDLLRHIPGERMRDVIYFNPADLAYPIGLNLLELPQNVSGDELLIIKDFITESVISMMRKIFSDDDTGGHRIEYILRNTIHTAFTVGSPTLFTVFDLLTNPAFRRTVVRSLTDDRLRNFWTNEFGKAGDFARVKMASGVTNKIGRFQFSATTERIIGQPHSTINFEEILNGKILICNFAKGLIGEDTATLFGIATLAKLQLAAYRRVVEPRSERRPFYIYVDEFQNFATRSFEQLLSEARKYKVFLTIAEQSTVQQDRRLIDNILANVGTIISFRTGSPIDEQILLPHFAPYVVKGELLHLPSYHFYASVSAVTPQEPMSGETIYSGSEGSQQTAGKIIASSRQQYAAHYHNKVQATETPVANL